MWRQRDGEGNVGVPRSGSLACPPERHDHAALLAWWRGRVNRAREKPAAQTMDRVLAAVRDLGIPHPDGPAGVVTISAGVAELTADVASPEDWLRRADAALYRAKGGGRDRLEADER